MPIIGELDSVVPEYIIPDDIKRAIPDNFYSILKEELITVFGEVIFEQLDEIDDEPIYSLDYIMSTGGWVSAFRNACIKSQLDWLLDYYDMLMWYAADIFDAYIGEQLSVKYQKDLL